MYIDTSSLVAYYLPEQKSKIAQQIISGADRVQISQLTDVEMLSALNKKVRMQKVSKEKSDETFRLFREQQKQGLFESFDLTESVFKASELILRTTSNPLRALDAIHLGLSYEYGMELFSFDNLLVKTAEEFNIPTIEV